MIALQQITIQALTEGCGQRWDPKISYIIKALPWISSLININGVEDLIITIFNKAETEKKLKERQVHWLYKIKTYAPQRLSEQEMYEAY